MDHIRTKIICTIGPAVSEYQTMLQLVEAGMSVARLNFSHGTHDEHLKNITHLKRVRKELKCPLAIMLDMKGPKIRVDKVQNGAITLSPKQRICLVEKGDGSPSEIPFHPIEALSAIRPG
ncbi:MAG: Pyruvate kinase, partial [Chlamydiota bacterium]